jgi:hypothetical protein
MKSRPLIYRRQWRAGGGGAVMIGDTADVLEGLIKLAVLFGGGLYAVLLGFRVVGRRPGQNLAYDRCHGRYATTFKVSGALMMAVGIVLAAMSFLKH